MDFAQQATYVIKRYNAYRNGKEVFLHDLIIDVCNLFDIAMDTQLKSSDYQFLRYPRNHINEDHYSIKRVVVFFLFAWGSKKYLSSDTLSKSALKTRFCRTHASWTRLNL